MLWNQLCAAYFQLAASSYCIVHGQAAAAFQLPLTHSLLPRPQVEYVDALLKKGGMSNPPDDDAVEGLLLDLIVLYRFIKDKVKDPPMIYHEIHTSKAHSGSSVFSGRLQPVLQAGAGRSASAGPEQV